ncbi:MAG: HAMP domain-containing histidine kinase [Clostridium sp.]|nr:HAMP domain-containing histidine kinase [Clostridium sp.]MCM1444009.1 HAMP domain-containing histidine kinase [Candidatus Amulumruptor caecigallinarius]
MKHKKSYLRTKIWLYLIALSVSILIFLWLFQIFFLGAYYSYYKNREVLHAIDEIKEKYDDFDFKEKLDDISKNNEVCIEIVRNNSVEYLSALYNKGCIGAEKSQYIDTFKNKFISSNLEEGKYTLTNSRFKNKTILYAVKLDENTFSFISASLEPMETAIIVFKNQFFFETILVIILSLLVSYFVSKRISKPITKMNVEAKKLASGDYKVDFNIDDSIIEINELSQTLEYTKNQLSKIEDTRRELLANISHDLKTPLTMIKAYAEMIRDLTIDNKEKSIKNLNIIIEETDRLNVLVNDIMDLSSIRSGTQKLVITEFDINELIKTIIKRFNIMIEQENYIFKINLLKNSIKVLGDIKRIEQVIYNLINNAINYTGNDKTIIINLIDNKDYVRVEIKDTGNGIDESELQNIWEKYYKIDKTHSRVQVGSGIGLSIVKNILINHGYNYGVKTNKEKGTTFYFDLKKVEKRKK